MKQLKPSGQTQQNTTLCLEPQMLARPGDKGSNQGSFLVAKLLSRSQFLCWDAWRNALICLQEWQLGLLSQGEGEFLHAWRLCGSWCCHQCRVQAGESCRGTGPHCPLTMCNLWAPLVCEWTQLPGLCTQSKAVCASSSSSPGAN